MRSPLLVAVHLFFLKADQILLLRRFNTGYEDGNYSVVAGHVDAGETVTQAAVREALEEAGVTLQPEHLQVVHVMNRKSNDERVDFFVTVKSWSGEIQNRGLDKCDDLAWFPLAELPANMIDRARVAVRNFAAGGRFSTYPAFGM